MNKNLPLISLFIMSIISILYWRLKPKEELYEAKWNAPDTTLAITIDGEISTSFPTTNAYTGTVECTTGTGKIEWNGSKWVLTTSGITKGSTKCNAIFNKKPTFAETILTNNEVKTPLTEPGKEVSAYTLDDVTTTSTGSVDSTFQAYYFTYGTGWEANGTMFNLTGAAVTSDTYANSYSSLVGKYLVACYVGGAGSSTAGKMRTTTNLGHVYYVVSVTKDSFTCKELTSNKNETEALLASTEDDYGTSYYFRGAVKNNYVQFANKCWRIVRVNGDNSVKLVLHNDNTSKVANPCSSVNNSDTAAFAHYNGDTYRSAFNSSSNDNAYVGFMYGEAGASDYASAHANTNKSTILTNLETWYTNNLASYADKLADTIWCNDKSVVTDTNFDPWGFGVGSNFGYGSNDNFYSTYKRLFSSADWPSGTGPSLICPNDNNGGKLSKFTVDDTTNGNGNLTYKIGLLTADEIVFSGSISGYRNNSTYLQENTGGSCWWSLSPSSASAVILVCEGDFFGYDVSVDNSLRPAISLVSSITVSGGSGTSEDPYIVN